MTPDDQESTQSVGALQVQTRVKRGRPLLVSCMVLLLCVTSVGAALAYYGTDDYLRVGYRPLQPIEFSHKLHSGELGLDCRFCHTGAERGAHAKLPASMLCMDCHNKVLPESLKLLPLRATYAENRPIPWVRVTKLPEFTYFHHGIHLKVGVGCSTCHGEVDTMTQTEQALSLSMGFCVECHRNPAPFLRPARYITRSDFAPGIAKGGMASNAVSPEGRVLSPPLHCGGCHR